MLAELIGPDGARLLADDHGADHIDPERFARFAAALHRLPLVPLPRCTVASTTSRLQQC